jgi:ion channel-forming bestrophin family protein
MIDYNPKDWFTFIFKIHKTDTVRRLVPMMLAISLYAGIIAYFEISFWHIGAESYVKNIPVVHTLLGFVISTLLVFRTNTAYDRWWEGRKLWGTLVNSSRNMAMKLNAFIPATHEAERNFFKKIIPAYTYALKNHLQTTATRQELAENIKVLMPNSLQQHKHIPNQIAMLMYIKIQELLQKGIIAEAQLIVLNTELTAFTDVCGACERIKNTPIPYSYSAFIKKFIFFYVMTMPFGFAISLGYYVIPVVIFVFYVLASLELIAEEIEDPFDGDTNDVPTEKIAANIHKHVFEIFE